MQVSGSINRRRENWLFLLFLVGTLTGCAYGQAYILPLATASASEYPEIAWIQPADNARIDGTAARSPVQRPSGSQQVDLYASPVLPFSKIAVGVEGGTLGIGLQLATSLTRTLNLRGGADFLNFAYNLTLDAAEYGGESHLRSGHVSLDWHPLGGGFRLSPTLVVFESSFGASVFVPGGNSFELGKSSYLSAPADPVHGTASIAMARRVMPAFTVGWGNMLGERSRRWTIPFEIGAAYTGHYTVQLNLAGTACINLVFCMSTTNPKVQQSVAEEEGNLNETMKHFQIYPIVTTGFGFRF